MHGDYQSGKIDRDIPSAPPTSSAHVRSSPALTFGLDHLRRNVNDVQLQEWMHRPYYPSPLSQSPLQASVSSASHTAASVASSSRNTVSTSNTHPSTSSQVSITRTFKDLTEDDLNFFDRLISTLPPNAADFSQLKLAYTSHLARELDQRHQRVGPADSAPRIDWDAHLWSILLSLVKVRGRNWRERWDSVRLAFGLDPHSSGDETDQSADTQTSLTASESFTHDEAESPIDHGLDEPQLHPLYATRAPAGSAFALTPRQSRVYESILPDREALGLPRSSTPPSVRNGAGTRSSAPPASTSRRGHNTEGRQAREHLDESIAAIQARLGHLFGQGQDPDVSNGSDDPSVSCSTEATLNRDEALSGPTARLPTNAKRRFSELIRSSHSERVKRRQSQYEMQEREEQQRWGEQLQAADLWRARRLLQMCLAWWVTLTRQQLDKIQNAADASARVTIDKAWEKWSAQTQRETEGSLIGERTDRVRCALTALRRWKRRAHAAAERREELKKESMRTAYYSTTSAVKTRLMTQAFRTWREHYLVKLADGVRRRHLQAGALALWQMRATHAQQLQNWEKMVSAKLNQSTLAQAWERWTDRFEKARALNQFQLHHNRLLIADMLHTWRKLTLLYELSRAFTDRRLKLAALDSWKTAVSEKQLRRKQESLAIRWRNRRLKHSAIITWCGRRQQLRKMEEQALAILASKKRDMLHGLLHRWQSQSRAALLQRVRSAATIERTFHHWKHRYAALITDLQQRESSILKRRHEATTLAFFRRWSGMTAEIREREAQVETHRNDTLRQDYFIAWRNKQLQYSLLEQKSTAVYDFFTMRSAVRRWRTRLREQRAEMLEATHKQRLAHQVLEIWRARTAKQRRLASLLQHSLAHKNEALARSYLTQWVARIIEVRSRELEVKEQRQRRLLKAAFYAWIEACLRHDDLLALMNSYIDVKEEDRKKRMFGRWLGLAREHKDRREKAETLAASTQRRLLASAFLAWREKLGERALATQEYEMLIRRQHLSLHWALSAWKSQTRLLPAIRMRNTSLKRAAFQHWRRILPGAQMFNQAAKDLRMRSLQRTWLTWKEKGRSRRQLRAAARFGAGSISAERLRTLSAAAAANRSSGSSSPLLAHSSSPYRVLHMSSSTPPAATPLRRTRTSLALLPPLSIDRVEQEADDPESDRRTSRHPRKAAVSAHRSTSVPRHFEASLVRDSPQNLPQQRRA